MADEKVYYPQTIDDQPFPQADGESLAVSQSSTEKVYSPQTIQEQPLPRRTIAREVISQVLNTKARKITGELQYTEQGATQIGKYVPGVSGDMRLSKTGMVVRNTSGENTITMDAETGDVTIKGTLQAGTIIGAGEDVVIEDSSEGNGRFVLYNSGTPSVVIGDPS
jgi:hypothetical protein